MQTSSVMKVRKNQDVNYNSLNSHGNAFVIIIFCLSDGLTSENPLMESKEEQELAVDIDQELNEVLLMFDATFVWLLHLFRLLFSWLSIYSIALILFGRVFRLSDLFPMFSFQLAECINQMRSCSSGIKLTTIG